MDKLIASLIIQARFPNHIVKIGHMDHPDYKANYHKLKKTKDGSLIGYSEDKQGIKK